MSRTLDAQAAVEHLRAADPELALLVDRIGPLSLQPESASSTFGALAQAIVYQQLNGRAASAIFARLSGLFPELTAEHVLAATDEQLRTAGLSRAKVLSLRDLAQRTVLGELPTLDEVAHLDDEAIIARLSQVRGIGRWTAQMFLIFRLGRPDVLPVDDFGIRKGFGLAFSNGAMPTRQEVEARGERWKPYRTVASWYLWRAAAQTPLTA